jgi:hypothetical protein
MEKHEFKILINASPEKVWGVLWSDNSYPMWTSVFAEGSKAETDWKEGSKVLFLDGNGQGMISFIEERRDNEYMSFKHVGTVKDGTEDMNSKETREWGGAMENYTLKPINGKTELVVDMDIAEEYKDYFLKTWPKALDKLKELAE